MDPLLQLGVALVTGAGSGIGREVSLCYAVRGCRKLFLVDISQENLEETQKIIHSEFPATDITLQITDISKRESVKEMVAKCVEKYGRLDFAVNNAGVASGTIKTTDLDVAMLDRCWAVNAKGTFFCHQEEIAQMQSQDPLSFFKDNRAVRGSIVDTASLCGIAVLGTMPAYNSSKHAVVSLVRVDAREYAAKGIRINCVCPGFVDTPMLRGAKLDASYRAAAESQSPMNRLMNATEIAEAVVFLSGSGASGITGVDLPVDAGSSLFHVF